MSGACVFATAESVSAIKPAEWDALANPDPARFNPFVAHAFLLALEQSGSATVRTGWRGAHASVRDKDGRLVAAAPLYLKSHSRGEYVFDQGWAEAWERAGREYYPKLLCAVPFTPVTGPRLMAHDAQARAFLADALIDLTRENGLSSLHVNFLPEDELNALAPAGFLKRMDQQFHFINRGYSDFGTFLATLSHDKRKNLRRERARALENDISFVWKRGKEITETDWDHFFAFYMDTGNRKWGSPYLTRAFFSLLGAAMGESVLLILAARARRPIAGALNLIGGDAIYGRYWGAIEHHPFLHFETCYHQAIDFALANGLARVEAGAQGMHKLARGYEPVPVYSAHFIADERLRDAVARYLKEERKAVAEDISILSTHTPFRKNEAPTNESGGLP